MTEQQLNPIEGDARNGEPLDANQNGVMDILEPEPQPVEHDVPDEVVEQIRLAERAAQRSLCVIPEGDLPDALAQALARRVEVNLAQYDGKDIVRVGSKDPEVRALEAPFSKRRAAGSIDRQTQEGQS